MEACLTSRDDPWMNPESQKYEPFHESLRIEIQDNPLQSDFDRDSEDEAAFGKMIERVPPTDDASRNFGDEGTSDSESSGSTSSLESDTDEVLSKAVSPSFRKHEVLVWRHGFKVHQHSKSKILHLDPCDGLGTFVCGRKMGPGYRPFEQNICMDQRKCIQCSNGRPVRNYDGAINVLDRVLKRARKSS